MSDIKTLESALAEAKTAYEADKTIKANKKVYKKAKKALAAAQEAAAAAAQAKAAKKKKKKRKRETADEGEAPKKAKTDVEALTAALASAKAAHKADKSDASLKKAYKAAKKALAAASAQEETKEETTEVPVETKTENVLDTLMKKKPAAAAASSEGAALHDYPPSAKLFCGNLSWDIDENAIKEFFKDCGTINDVHWLMDKTNPDKFLGMGFVTFDSIEMANKAIEKHETELAGRNIRISYAKPPRAGGGGGGSKGGRFVDKPLSARPDNCTTAFIGNVSFEIDDDAVYKFAEGCGEVKAIRWLTDRETGDFKGCGFVEFWKPEDLDKFVELRGQELMGRRVRIDYSASRAK